MTLDKSGAAEALAEIGQSQKRSAMLYAYATSAPYLFLTGAMWMSADLLFQFTEFGKHWAWPLISGVSLPLYIGLAIYQSRRRWPKTAASGAAQTGNLDTHFWKGMAIWVLIFAFVGRTFRIFWPISGVQVHSFIGLLTGIAYTIFGLWMGKRILATGLAIAALTMIAFFQIHEYYTAFMGVVCGGGMMLSGLWLRRV